MSDYGDDEDYEELEEEELEEEELEEEDEEKEPEEIIIINDVKIIDAEKRRSIPILNKFEKISVLKYRVQELEKGSQPYIDLKNPFEFTGDRTKVIDIAIAELKMRRLPFSIQRKMADDSIEIWRIDELEIIDF